MSITPKHMPLVKLCGILLDFFHLKLAGKKGKKSSKCAESDAADVVMPPDIRASSYPLQLFQKCCLI